MDSTPLILENWYKGVAMPCYLARHLESFVQEQGHTVDDFFAIVEADTSSQFNSGSTFAAVVNAATQFRNFAELMLDASRGEFAWGMPPLEDTETGELVFE